MTPHHRREESGEVLHERRSDGNPFAKLAAGAEKYKILWVIGFGIAMWIGSRIIQPLNSITEVTANQAAMLVRLTAAERTQTDMAHAISILTKIACVKNLTAADQYAFGVTCLDLPIRDLK